MKANKIISRTFEFADCGIIVIEGNKAIIEGVSDMIQIKARDMEKKGLMGHGCIRVFTGIFSSQTWQEKYPEAKMVKSKITCPSGRLCVH